MEAPAIHGVIIRRFSELLPPSGVGITPLHYILLFLKGCYWRHAIWSELIRIWCSCCVIQWWAVTGVVQKRGWEALFETKCKWSICNDLRKAEGRHGKSCCNKSELVVAYLFLFENFQYALSFFPTCRIESPLFLRVWCFFSYPVTPTKWKSMTSGLSSIRASWDLSIVL